MPSGASLKCLTWLSASKVGNHTTRPKPPCIRHIQLTASGLMPPAGELRTTPPNTFSPATRLRTSQARSAVGQHMVLEDERLQPALLVEHSRLLVVHGTAKD